jgi:hypothetical protein
MMSVTVDREPLAAAELGLHTVGQVLSHLKSKRRLVVHVLIDGQEPDLGAMAHVRRSPLDGHTLFIETADPRQLAIEALAEVDEQLQEADRLRVEASDLLARGHNEKAMGKLSGCFSTWQAAQESVLKTAQLLRVDINIICVGARTLPQILAEFTDQLRNIRTALIDRDFALLNDILTYEATQTSAQWREALASLRGVITAKA